VLEEVDALPQSFVELAFGSDRRLIRVDRLIGQDECRRTGSDATMRARLAAFGNRSSSPIA